VSLGTKPGEVSWHKAVVGSDFICCRSDTEPSLEKRGQLSVDRLPGDGTALMIKMPRIRQPARNPDFLPAEAQSNG
jgi:hypothetical protein